MKRDKRQRKEPPPISTGAVPGTRSITQKVILASAVLLTAGVVWAVFEFWVWNTVPSALVGKWVVSRGPDEGATMDIHRNGSMVARINQNGFEGFIYATIKVEGKTIRSTVRKENGETGTRVQTIKTLEPNRLVLQDENGVSIDLERAE